MPELWWCVYGKIQLSPYLALPFSSSVVTSRSTNRDRVKVLRQNTVGWPSLVFTQLQPLTIEKAPVGVEDRCVFDTN